MEITTPAQMMALTPGTIVVDKDGTGWQYFHGFWHGHQNVGHYAQPSSKSPKWLFEMRSPLHVVHSPTPSR
jgi:hypothetical protein